MKKFDSLKEAYPYAQSLYTEHGKGKVKMQFIGSLKKWCVWIAVIAGIIITFKCFA